MDNDDLAEVSELKAKHVHDNKINMKMKGKAMTNPQIIPLKK